MKDSSENISHTRPIPWSTFSIRASACEVKLPWEAIRSNAINDHNDCMVSGCCLTLFPSPCYSDRVPAIPVLFLSYSCLISSLCFFLNYMFLAPRTIYEILPQLLVAAFIYGLCVYLFALCVYPFVWLLVLTTVLNTRREREAVAYACDLYREKFHRDPHQDRNLVLNLSDNPKKRLCWSGTSKALPTFRTNSTRFYNISREQWLTARDRLAALGLPVTPKAALAMGVPILPVPCHCWF